MEFKSLKNIETSFRQIRLFGIVFVSLCAMIAVVSVILSLNFAEKQREKIYVLDNGKSLIEHNINRAMSLADKSAYNYYTDYVEKGYYNRIIAGNITQVLQVDSIVCNFNDYPYNVRTFARQMIIRQSNVTERSLITNCRLVNTNRSDDNPNGFMIEGLTILENKDLITTKRTLSQ